MTDDEKQMWINVQGIDIQNLSDSELYAMTWTSRFFYEKLHEETIKRHQK